MIVRLKYLLNRFMGKSAACEHHLDVSLLLRFLVAAASRRVKSRRFLFRRCSFLTGILSHVVFFLAFFSFFFFYLYFSLSLSLCFSSQIIGARFRSARKQKPLNFPSVGCSKSLPCRQLHVNKYSLFHTISPMIIPVRLQQ